MGYTICVKCNSKYETNEQDGKHIPSTRLLIENCYCPKCRNEFVTIKKNEVVK